MDRLRGKIVLQLGKIAVWRAPDVWFIGARERNVTALSIDDRTVLIDPGLGWWEKDLLRTFPQIDEIWLTHAHPDHCAIAGILQTKFESKILAPQQEKPIIENPGAFLQKEYKAAGALRNEIFPQLLQPLGGLMQRFVYGNWPAAKLNYTFDDLGMNIDEVEIIKLPGHSEGSVGFRLSDGDKVIVIVGDLIQKRAASEPVLSINLPGSDLTQAISSVKKIDIIRPDILISGHGEILRGANDIAKSIEGCVQKYERYEDQILQFIKNIGQILPLADMVRRVPFSWPPNYNAAFTQKRALILAVLKSLYLKSRLPEPLKGLERIKLLSRPNSSFTRR